MNTNFPFKAPKTRLAAFSAAVILFCMAMLINLGLIVVAMYLGIGATAVIWFYVVCICAKWARDFYREERGLL